MPENIMSPALSTPRSLLLLLLLTVLAAATASPLARPQPQPQSSMRVSFVSPPHSYSHSVQAPPSRFGRARLPPPGGIPQRRSPPAVRGMTLALVTSLSAEPTQHPGYFLSRPAPRQRLPRTFGFIEDGRELSNSVRDPEAMWPMGVFLPPDHDLQLVHLSLDSGHHLFSEPDATPDPFLRTGQDAVQVVRYLFSLGELFFDKYPHADVLLRHQQERLANGLAGNKLGSIRPESPFYRWPMAPQQQRARLAF